MEFGVVEVLGAGQKVKDFILTKSQSSIGRSDIEDSFAVMDLGRVIDLYETWKSVLPNVHPFYAVKCNSDLMLLKLLASLGTGFDCASKNEIQTILDLDVSPDRVIYSNTDKPPSYLQYTSLNKVHLMTVDSELELHKVKKHQPSAQLLIRLKTREDGALCFSSKFGCSVSTAKQLLDIAHQLELHVVGTAFHVGGGHDLKITPNIFLERLSKVMEDSSAVFKYALETGHQFTTLNIGGGFSGYRSLDEQFLQMAAEVSRYIEDFLQEHQKIRVMAEPGHYFACSPITMAACVINKKIADDGSIMYITSNGKYSSFRYLLPFPSMKYYPKILQGNTSSEDGVSKCSVWGHVSAPDKVADDVYLPSLELGDWLYYEDMGGYSFAMDSCFNGFSKPVVYYCVTDSHQQQAKDLLPLIFKQKHT